jgi:hypothetical protein
MSTGKRLSREKKIEGLKLLLKVVRSKEFGKRKYLDGLCLITYSDRVFTLEFDDFLYSILPKRKMFRGIQDYCFEPGAKAPRVRFLQEQIKKLEKK